MVLFFDLGISIVRHLRRVRIATWQVALSAAPASRFQSLPVASLVPDVTAALRRAGGQPNNNQPSRTALQSKDPQPQPQPQSQTPGLVRLGESKVYWADQQDPALPAVGSRQGLRDRAIPSVLLFNLYCLDIDQLPRLCSKTQQHSNTATQQHSNAVATKFPIINLHV